MCVYFHCGSCFCFSRWNFRVKRTCWPIESPMRIIDFITQIAARHNRQGTAVKCRVPGPSNRGCKVHAHLAFDRPFLQPQHPSVRRRWMEGLVAVKHLNATLLSNRHPYTSAFYFKPRLVTYQTLSKKSKQRSNLRYGAQALN